MCITTELARNQNKHVTTNNEMKHVILMAALNLRMLHMLMSVKLPTCRPAPLWSQVGTHWGSPAPSGTGAPVPCTAGGPSAGTSCACWVGSSPTGLGWPQVCAFVCMCQESKITLDELNWVQVSAFTSFSLPTHSKHIHSLEVHWALT